MSDPWDYTFSDYYHPGMFGEVALMVLAVMAALGLFFYLIIRARMRQIAGRRRRRGSHALVRLLGDIARPRGEAGLSRRHRRHGRRHKHEKHYRLGSAPGPAGVGAAAFASEAPTRVERTRPRPVLPADLAMQPGEAWPYYDADEIAAATEPLRTGKVNQWTGSRVFEFERAYESAIGRGRAVALANGSVALELALRALGIGAGDEVIVTPRSFVASAFCAELVGATPVFADVDPDSGAITAATIEAAISPRTRAVIPVHLAGWPADMPAIMALARARDLVVIEDCAQAHGAEIGGAPVGSFGDAATFSFCQDKIISTGGEGGLALFQDERAFERAWSFKDHGKNRARALQPSGGTGFRWLHDTVGTNWRLTEFAAAIGLKQLEKLPEWRARRAANARIWADALSGIAGLRVPWPEEGITGAFYKLYAYVDLDRSRNAAVRDEILARAAAEGLRAFSGSCSEIYREAAFAGRAIEPLPVARALGESSLMFEVHPTLDELRLRGRAEAMARIVRATLEKAA